MARLTGKVDAVAQPGQGSYRPPPGFVPEADARIVTNKGEDIDDLTIHAVPGKITVFDFYADWCGPCRMMAPSVDTLARETAGRALVAKLDTDAAQRTAGRFQIRGIPTSIVFRGGREVARQTGAVSLSVLRGMLG